MKAARCLFRLPALVLLLICMAVATGGAADWDKEVVFEPLEVTGIRPAAVSAKELEPGLRAYYYIGFFERDLRKLPASEGSAYKSFQGEPILSLNHQFGEDEVFDSHESRGVGLRMTGYLHFPDPGTYDLQALSNDGVIMKIDGKTVLNDPEQHSDRLSNVAHVSVVQAGWYPVVIEYFQRKGTAALKLLWRAPGAETMSPVPASSYGHQQVR